VVFFSPSIDANSTGSDWLPPFDEMIPKKLF
jgi:hypothetical protein